MPIVALNIPLATFNEITELVKKSRYASAEQFLEIAALNQLSLERGTKVADLVRKLEDDRVTTTRKADRLRSRPIGISLPKSAELKLHQGDLDELRRRISSAAIQSERIPRPLEPVNEDSRIWGQVNRYLPMKIAVRWILIQASQAREWPDFSAINTSLPNDASIVGSSLESDDIAHKRVREEMLCVGLPRSSNPQSQEKYMTQIVGRQTRAERFYPGAIFHYGLVALEDTRIGLTKAGIEFAQLPNPVMDSTISVADETLSHEEREFLRNLVMHSIPSELDDFRVILQLIDRQQQTPDALIGGARKKMPDSWTELTARTHVYGVLARMLELGLIAKQWEGRRVKYVVGAAGKAVAA